MASELQGLTNQYMASADANEASVVGIANDINQGNSSFLEFIRLLGSYLVEDSEAIRAKALNCICGVLSSLSTQKLSMKDCYFIMEFLINRLDDDFKNSIPGIESVLKMNNFKSSDLCEPLLNKIIKTYQPRQLLARNRYCVFNVLAAILDRFPTQLTAFNDLFIQTFIKVSTGEKDPRNLLISFDLNYRISTTFDISRFAEDLFDNSFCYYPISFKPPPNDPYKISSEQLKTALRKVLACNSLFAKDCIPNLIEKLSSTSSSVKLDSIYTLTECIESYSVSTVKEYSMSIWNSLKYEVLHNEMPNLQNYDDLIEKYAKSEIEDDHALPATLTLLQKLYIKVTTPEDDGDIEEHMTADMMIDELLKNLKPLDEKKAKQSNLILSSLSSTSVANFNLVITKSFSVLLAPDQSLSVANQRLLIVYIQFYFDAYLQLFENHPSSTSGTLAIANYKDDILIQLSKSLVSSSEAEVSLRCLAIDALLKLSQLPNYLEMQEKSLIVQYFTDVLLSDANQTTSGKVLASLVALSSSNTNVLLEVTLPKLLVLLPDDEVAVPATSETMNSKEKILETISALVVNKQLLDVILIRLSNKVSFLLSQGESTGEYACLLLSTMINAITKTQKNIGILRLDDYLHKVVPQLLQMIVENEFILKNDYMLEICTKLIKLIIVNTDPSTHQHIINCIFEIFINGSKSSPLLLRDINRSIDVLKTPNKLIIVFVKILSAVDKSKTKLSMDVDEFISKLIAVCELDSLVKTPYTRLGYLQTLSLVVNKYSTGKCDFIESTIEMLTSSNDPAANLPFYKNMEILTWITKALMLKGSTLSEGCEAYVISLLSNSNSAISNIASRSLEVIIANCELFETYTRIVTVFGQPKQEVFNADVRLLHKQKFFNFVIPKLVASFQTSDSETYKKNYLVSLSVVLKYVDSAVMAAHIEQAFPLVTKSLFFEAEQNQNVINSSINIILMSLAQDSSLVNENLRTILPRLLELVNDKVSEEIKLNCLRGLVEVTKTIDHRVLMDYREGVIRNLEATLDDRKRKVRKLAADCRQIYYDLDQLKEK